MQRNHPDGNADRVHAHITFIDLPAELCNQVYNDSGLFHCRDGDGNRKLVNLHSFSLNNKRLLSVFCADAQIAAEVKSILLGDPILHLTAERWDGYVDPRKQRSRKLIFAQIQRQEAHRAYLCRHHYYNMDLPPLKLRPFFRHLKITLTAPMDRKEKLQELIDRELLDSEVLELGRD